MLLLVPQQVLFDHNGVLRKYETVDQILREFFELRLQYYEKRKAYLVGFLEAEACKLSNQVRYKVLSFLILILDTDVE